MMSFNPLASFRGWAAMSASPLRQRGHEAGRLGTEELATFNPGGFMPDDDFRDNGERIINRIRDMDANNGWLSGALDRRTEAVVGNNIQLSAQPMHNLLSQTPEWRREWARSAQDLFWIWANDLNKNCDARRMMRFGPMVELAYMHYCREGEIAAEIRMNDRGSTFRTNVRLVDADLISNPHNIPNSKTLRNGIYLSANGEPIAYSVRKQHIDDSTPTDERWKWNRIPAYGPTGRHRFIHIKKGRRVDQLRGISKFVQAVVPAKMVDRIDRAELSFNLLQTLMSVFLKSPKSDSSIFDAIQAPIDGGDGGKYEGYLDHRKNNKISMGPLARIFHLFPDEDVKFQDRGAGNQNYPDFIKIALQKISSSTGISYSQLSQNWADLNYSSARAMLNEMWRGFLQDRHFFVQDFCTPIYAALMEEAVVNKHLAVPGGVFGFYQNKTALTRCHWIGPGRGSVDPKKEADANNADTAALRKSTPQAIRGNGDDPQDVIAEQAAFVQMVEEAGLPPPNHDVSDGPYPSDEEEPASKPEPKEKKPQEPAKKPANEEVAE